MWLFNAQREAMRTLWSRSDQRGWKGVGGRGRWLLWLLFRGGVRERVRKGQLDCV